MSVCWSCLRAVQKWLNRLRCRLGADSGGPRKPCIRWVPVPSGEWAILGVVLTNEKYSEPLQWYTQKRMNQLKCRLGANSCWPKEALLDGGRGRMNPFATRGVTSQRCGLSSKFCDHLLIFSLICRFGTMSD